MRSEAQRQARRTNGAKSRGPKTAEGKAVSRMNGLVHGLRAEQVVLPGEDPAEFEAEIRGWLDDWGGAGHTAAVLCERAAASSWRMRRAVRAEADRLREAADRAGRAFDDARERGLDRAIGSFRSDPAEAVARLEADPVGVGVLLRSWGELAEALAGDPAAWSADDHVQLMALLGRLPGEDPAGSGPSRPSRSAWPPPTTARTRPPRRGGPPPSCSTWSTTRWRGFTRHASTSPTPRTSAAAPSARPWRPTWPRTSTCTATRWRTTARSGRPSAS